MTNFNNDTTMMTVAEVSKTLKTNCKTILKLLNSGKLAGFRYGNRWMIPYAAVLQYKMTTALPSFEYYRELSFDNRFIN